MTLKFPPNQQRLPCNASMIFLPSCAPKHPSLFRHFHAASTFFIPTQFFQPYSSNEKNFQLSSLVPLSASQQLPLLRVGLHTQTPFMENRGARARGRSAQPEAKIFTRKFYTSARWQGKEKSLCMDGYNTVAGLGTTQYTNTVTMTTTTITLRGGNFFLACV